MKLEKLSYAGMKRELTPKERKKIMAGINDCQNYGEPCDPEKQLNCCNGLVCINGRCGLPSELEELKKNQQA